MKKTLIALILSTFLLTACSTPDDPDDLIVLNDVKILEASIMDGTPYVIVRTVDEQEIKIFVDSEKLPIYFRVGSTQKQLSYTEKDMKLYSYTLN